MNEEIYEKYASKIYIYIYTLCKSEDIAEEILQDTFVSALKSIENFKGNSSIYTWLSAIARNKWKNYLKRKKNITFIPLSDDIPDTSHTEDFENKEKLIKMYEILDELDPTIKEIILLKLHSDLTFKEIGNLFGKSEQWARTNFYRGKLKIRKELKYE